MRQVLTVLGCLAVWSFSVADPALAQADGPIIVRAAHMLDVESGHLTDDAAVVVENGLIVAVNPPTFPEEARVVDLGDLTLLPGLIDAHTHLAGQMDASSFTSGLRETLADQAFDAARHARTTVLAGFTTVRDFGGDVTVALKRAVESRDVVGPRVVPSRHSLGITGGHCDVTGYAPGILEQGIEAGVADGPWEVVEAVRYQIKHGAEVIKVCATAGVLSFEGPVGAQQYSEAELEAIVAEATRHGLKVAAHAHGTEGIKAAVRAGVASIEHGSMLDAEAIALMKARGTYLVPTVYLTERVDVDALPPPIRRKAMEVKPLALDSIRRAIAADVKIAFGTDAAVYPHGENAKEFGVLVKLGMEPLEALRSATLYAADLLGKDDRGQIAPGRVADLIGVSGNPLDDITVTEEVSWVMVGGEIIKAAHP